MLSDQDIEEIRKLHWYSSIELAPGLYTRDTLEYWTTSLPRQALEHADLREKRCLDVGAVDGFMAALMKREGAATVTAIDCMNFSRQVALVQRCLGVQFDYFPGVGTLKMVDRLIDIHKFGNLFTIAGRSTTDTDFAFDFINCSGVMYHLYSPIHLIGALRTLIRPGGIVIVETAMMATDGHDMSFNYFGSGQYVYGLSATWFITPGLLDYLLRMFSLQPIDILYRHNKIIDHVPRSIGRAAIVCRAVDKPLALPEEHQMLDSVKTFEFDEIYKRELEGLKKWTWVDYTPWIGPEFLQKQGEFEHLDLLGAIRAQEALPIDYNRARLPYRA